MRMSAWINTLFSREEKGDGPEEGGAGVEPRPRQENPYLSTRRTWNDMSKARTSNSQTWQLIGILGLMIGLAGVGGAIYIGSQSRFIPYVVEVDKLGQAVAVAPAQQAAVADPRIMNATVASFISDIRTVTPDVALQRKAIFRVYALLSANDPATVKSNEWLNGTEDSSPFKRATREMVSIEIETVIAQTPTTWQVDWIETTRDRQGIVQSQPFHMRALVTVYTAPPSSETDQIRMNPLGIYVRDFSWSKRI